MKKVSVMFVAFFLMGSTASFAKSSHLKAFKTAYPNAVTIAKCILCHEKGGYNRNYFGQDFEKAKYDFKAIENFDSDGDNFTNVQEYSANTFPGDKTSFPPKEMLERFD